MWILLLFSIISTIKCLYLPTLHDRERDSCDRLCENFMLPSLDPERFELYVCKTGCRFYNNADKDCNTTCKDSYAFPKEVHVCSIGCQLISSSAPIMPTEISRGHYSMFDTDLSEAEIYTDPVFKNQLLLDDNMKYRIPETFIRTMPIEHKEQPATSNVPATKPKDSGDWLDCASKNSGIPRWILLSIMSGAVLVALWLTLTMETRKGLEEADDDLLIRNPEVEPEETKCTEKEAVILNSDAFNNSLEVDSNGVKFSPPPEYSEISNLAEAEPPNYEEAIENREVSA